MAEPEPDPGPDVAAELETDPALTEPPEELEAGTKVGLLLPLTGPYAALGESLFNAVQLALNDHAGEDFTLLVEDTSGTPEGALGAMGRALDGGARLILGPLFGASVAAGAPDARALGVPVIAFSNDLTVAGDGVYLLGQPPGPQAARVIDYASRQGLRRFAALVPRNGYGDSAAEALQQSAYLRGIEISRVVTYDAANSDLSAEVQQLGDYGDRQQALEERRQELQAEIDDGGSEVAQLALKQLERLDTLGDPDFEALLLPLGGRSLMTTAPLLAYYDVDPAQVRFLGTSLWDDPRLGSEPTLVGGWYAAPSPDLWRGFSDRYRRIFGKAPQRVATLGYDATALAAILAKQGGTLLDANPFGPEAITQPSGFAGLDGIFRFQPSGEVERGLAVIEVGEKGPRVLEPAPASFQVLTN